MTQTKGRRSIAPAVFLLALLVSWTGSARADGPLDPALNWRTLRTGHFEVHFAPESLEPDARRVATIAEETHAVLVERLGWTPRAKTHIILTDSSDFANGVTAVFPYPRMLLYLANPRPNDTLDTYDDWLRTLIAHEYAHVIMMDMARGLPGVLRAVFGRSIAMNALSPDWWIEGFATWEETDLTTMGRGRGTYSEMVVRTAFLSGKNLDIGRAGDGRIRWPGGETPYIYGLSFVKWLADTQGREKVAAFLNQYSKQAFPFRVNRAAKRSFGAGMTKLWKAWEAETRQRAEAVKSAVEANGVREGKRVTNLGYGVMYPTFSRDGKRVFFYNYNPHEAPSIRALDIETGAIEKIATAKVFGSMTLSTDEATIYYSGLASKGTEEYSARYYLFTALKAARVGKSTTAESKKSTSESKANRLYDYRRLADPCISPDGKTIAFALKSPGGDSLVIDNMDGSGEARVLLTRKGAVIDSPRFSPDGRAIAISLREGSARDIYLVDVATGEAKRLMSDIARDVAPSWSPDGKWILYSSDKSGVANIYAIDPATGATRMVTNVIGGAFDPVVSPDGKTIVYRGYTWEGFDLFSMPFDPASWTDTPTTAEAPISPKPSTAPNGGEVERYFPVSTLLPRYILPTFWYNGVEFQLGLTTGGVDPINENMWGATARWGSASNFIGWGFVYQNDQLPPSIALSVQQYVVSYGSILLTARDTNGDSTITVPDEFYYMGRDYFEKRTVASIGVSHVFLPKGTPIGVSATYSYEDRTNLDGLPDMVFDSMLPDRGVMSGVEFGFAASYLRQYPYSISPEAGVSLKAWFEILDESLGSDFNQRIYTADLRGFVPMPWLKHHVVALRAAGGVMDGDKLFQGTFRVGGTLGESIISSPGNKFFALRGFETNRFVGDSALVVSGEYRFPIAFPERAYGLFPVFLQKLHGAVFADYGGAFDRKTRFTLTMDGQTLVDSATGEPVVVGFKKSDDWNLGVGAELRVTGIAGWGVFGPPITVRAGIAHDVIGDGIGPTWYLDLGTTF